MLRISVLLLVVFVLTNCHQDKFVEDGTGDFVLKIPVGFPAPKIPQDNILTKDRVRLGKLLFYDPVLSKDSTKSCASCHLAANSFSDTVAFSLGIENRLGTRNSPSLANVVYQDKLLREGSVPSLEMQIAVPIQEHNEFDFNIVRIAERLNNNQLYAALSMEAYGRKPDPFVITRAIAAFERTLLSGNSLFDQWYFQKLPEAYRPEVARGFLLFQSDRLNCIQCHNGFLFTNQSYQNNGLYVNYPDSGRMRFTQLEQDRALFKVPSLRNVGLTGPYMHDGSLKSLDQVIDHYASGGKPHANKSSLLKSFVLNPEERKDLLAF
ncbi:MAG: cytochrome-c peroxidase [Saprospiraceae bacterium]|nr:cytochrome-c peroxidase [Candidatus Vicinibacter affinis]